MHFKKPIGLILVSACVLVAAACGGNDDDGGDPPKAGQVAESLEDLVAAAEAEGKLVVYGAKPVKVTEATIAKFEKKYPKIDVQLLNLPTGELSARLSGEQGAKTNTADVFQTADIPVINANEDWFIDLTKDPILSESIADMDDAVKTSRWAGTTVSYVGVTYNTDKLDVSDLPKTWDGFTDDKWRGKLMMGVLAASPSFMVWGDTMQKEYGDEFLSGIAALDPESFDSGVTAAQQVAAGAFEVALTTFASTNVQLVAAKAPIAMYFPDGPTPGNLHGISVLESAPNPNAARLFVQYILSAEGMAAECGDAVYATVIAEEVSACQPKSPNLVGPDFAITDERKKQLSTLLNQD